ncbi:MAG: cytidylate kinase-like family protein [Desulfamplus sp.]|nr:cytidylate kinase-like family protein [Desulfamplus sp.]
MTIITISRGSYSRGREVAELVAKQLGYDCISRDVLLEASERFNIPEIKLIRAIHAAPTILERLTYSKDEYITYIKAALLRYLREDNIVYHGLAGHFFVKNIPHVLKVRIIADIQERVKIEMEREKISLYEAEQVIKNDDEERKKWGLSLYGIDTSNSTLYDLIIHIGRIGAQDAADIICQTARLDCFKTTPESQKIIDNMALAAQVKAALIKINPNAEVSVSNDNINITARLRQPDSDIIASLETAAKSIAGGKDINVKILPITVFTD